MRKELLRVSTILRYPHKKRKAYIKVIPNKLDHLHNKVTSGVDTTIQIDEPADIRVINLYSDGKLVEDLKSPWVYLLAKYIGKYTETRIICHEQFVGLVNPIKTFKLVGAPTNVFYCYMLLRWAYYAIKWGTSSKDKHLAISIILKKLHEFLADTSIQRHRLKLSQSFRDHYLYNTITLPKVNHKQTNPEYAKIVTINMSVLPEGKFKNRKLIC